MQTFGWNLLQFARSVDNLPLEIVDGMKELTSKYFLRKDGLGACYFCVHRTGATFEGTPALKTVWSSDNGSEAQVVRRFMDFKNGIGTGSPSLRALAYNDDRCLWVIADRDAEGNEAHDGAALDSADADSIKDLWREHSGSDKQPLPPYVSMHDRPCKTLVALPLKHHREKLGVLVVEFERQIQITTGARQEAELLREALGRILWLQDAALSQLEGTRKAFEELKNVVGDSWSSVDPPTMFFAYPGKSDPAVTNAIKKIVEDEYGDRLVLSPWDQMASPGQITDQIVEAISHCRYGICYLSELADDPVDDLRQQRYADNSNVLIEAGMLHALRNSQFASTAAWIPVREAEDRTDTVPFDFVAERMLQVPRGEDGNVLIDEFEEEVKMRIKAMVDT